MKAYERFLNYVAIDTQSEDDSVTFPSTAKQKDLANVLVKEMIAMGLAECQTDEYGYVYGRLPATIGCEDAPTIALVAHMDTAPDLTGENVKPRIFTYEGGDIVLNEELGIITRAKDFPHLASYIGEDLIVTDGTTLLGADNKAGIAIILTLAEQFLGNPQLPHPTIAICFTPDEEVGCGVDHINLEKTKAQYAYTVDGGRVGEIEYENFNAANATINVQGVTAHPGGAKGRMINASHVAMEFHGMLPTFDDPAFTQDREGFFHLHGMTGKVEKAQLQYIIRDHDLGLFAGRKKTIEDIAQFLNTKYGVGTVGVDIKDSYFNMKEQILPHFHLIDKAVQAMEELDIVPIITPIRGGTDGARLSFMGLPCPNLCTGGQNFHGRHECISIQSMDKVVAILTGIMKSYGIDGAIK